MRATSRWAIALLLVVLGCTIRLYRLGDWPFAGDELATFTEEALLFSASPAEHASQEYRLPRAIPLSYAVQHLGALLFGRDEFGGRLLMALLGGLSAGLVFLGLQATRGTPASLATALLVVQWPDHVFLSQQTRFYITAAVVAWLCMLAGAAALRRGSVKWIAAACAASLAATLTHTLLAATLPLLLAALWLGSRHGRRWPPSSLPVFGLASLFLLAAFGVLYLRPLLGGWNAGSDWGYSIAHSLLASVNMIGWPVAVLATVGAAALLRMRNAYDSYWLTWLVGWLGCTVAFPLVSIYHPEYVFPLALAPMVAAGDVIGMIYESLASRGWLTARVWLVTATMLNLPTLVSHFIDGSRPDMRTAAQYVQSRWRPGDRVAGFSMGLFGHYAPAVPTGIPIPLSADAAVHLRNVAREPGRLWVVLQNGRSGLDPALDGWLHRECTRDLLVERRRFDYYENAVQVFRCNDARSTGP